MMRALVCLLLGRATFHGAICCDECFYLPVDARRVTVKNSLLEAFRRSGPTGLDMPLRAVRLPQGTSISLSDPQNNHAHFLCSGAASVAVRMLDGRWSPVRLCSAGDILEIAHLLGVSIPESRITMLVPGEAVRVPLPLLTQAFAQSEEFRRLALASIGIQSLEMERISICSRLHELGPRLARYLLCMIDRCGAQTIPITQEALSEELGVRRSSIALAAAMFRRANLLAVRRSRVQILDRPGLERVACECYPAIRKLRA
jgi:CRP-like cAMP-binding protein